VFFYEIGRFDIVHFGIEWLSLLFSPLRANPSRRDYKCRLNI